MSVMQFVPRPLLAQSRLATMTITRTYQTRQRLETRRRRLEEKKKAEAEAIDCYKSMRRTEYRCNQPRLKAMHEECLDPCDVGPLPMDLLHYTPSDKNRKYQRTWCECYSLPTKFVSLKKRYPKRARRNLRRDDLSKDCVEALNTKGSSRRKPPKLIDVKSIGKWPCCKLVAPGCPPGREDPSCGPSLLPLCCKKRRTKYPSFSECQPVGMPDPMPPCECVKKGNLCDMWNYFRRLDR
ncbi:hypothetical protein KR038_000391 [Drosophila bunnanda]|nr:hypothetical protein KR038_000391 [Drosophila bunnanda]